MTSNDPVGPVGPVGDDSAPTQMSMSVREIMAGPPPEGALGEGILFRTSRGDIQGILHRRAAKGVADPSPEDSSEIHGGVVWVCGARGGFGGPGPGSYQRLAEEFRGNGITSPPAGLPSAKPSGRVRLGPSGGCGWPARPGLRPRGSCGPFFRRRSGYRRRGGQSCDFPGWSHYRLRPMEPTAPEESHPGPFCWPTARPTLASLLAAP